MEITLSGRHVEVTDAMERRIRGRIDKLPRFDDQIRNITVTVSRDAGGYHLEIIAKCHGTVLVTNGQGQEVYDSIEEAFSKMERRIARSHEKLINKHSREAKHASEVVRKPQQQ